MTVGSFKSDREGRCECGNVWHIGDRIYFKPGERGYWCGECEQERMGRYDQAEPKPENPARQSSESEVAKGHRENMESARQTRDVIALLVTSVNALQKELAVLVTVLREGKR